MVDGPAATTFRKDKSNRQAIAVLPVAENNYKMTGFPNALTMIQFVHVHTPRFQGGGGGGGGWWLKNILNTTFVDL